MGPVLGLRSGGGDDVKVISLIQPWASLMAIGAKSIETRSWATDYWGPVAIHASKGFPREAKEECFGEPFFSALTTAGILGIGELPRGAVIAVGNLHKVGTIGRRADGAVIVAGLEKPIEGDELAFGDYTPGRYGWVFTNVRRLPVPIPAKGALGLWEWDWQGPVPAGCEWWLELGRKQRVYR
jgi:hypothetical protein